MGIGTNLKLALKEYDLTVAELSRKTGISTNTFYAMIRRDNNKISPDMLKKICDNTDITVYDLFDNYDELAAKYYDPKASKEEQTIGDYILTTMGNDDNLEGIIEIYGKLNNTGKKMAHEKISELEEVPQFTDSDNNIYIDPNLQKLYEVAIEKAVRHEELTEEEEQVIIGIPGQLRHKGDSYEDSYSFASSEEELNKLQKEHSIEPNERQNDKIHEYDAVVEITPEAMERLKEDAEAREILKKYESGEKILESEYKKVIEYHKRMMERFKLLQDWLEWYKSTCEPLNNEGRKKVAEYAETLAETDKYANSEEWFKGRPTKEEIDEALKAYLNDDAPEDVKDKWL